MANSILNIANCGNTANTGVNSCDVNPDNIHYAVAIPKGFVIPATQLTSVAVFAAAFKAYFQAADSRAARFWLSPLLTNMDDKTGDPITENRDNFEATVQFKPYNWGWLLNGSKCDYRNWRSLVSFNQSKFDFLFLDASGNVWYKPDTDSLGAAGAGGFSMFEAVVNDFMPKTSAALAKYPFRLQFANNDQMVNAGFIGASIFPDNTWGLVGTTLTAGATTNTTTQYYVKGAMGCGATSLGSTYGSTLAAAGAWVLRNTSTGVPIVPSAVTYDADNDQYKFTVTAAVAGNIISIKLAAPSVLTATPYFLEPAPITETGLTFASL